MEELRAEVKNILKKAHPPKPNITKEEWKAIEKLRKDDTQIVLVADKGVALVVMKREDYDKKVEDLLNTTTYITINSDPTTRYKNKLVSLLKTIKTQGGINDALYKKLYPTGAGVPKMYGLPKIHKRDTLKTHSLQHRISQLPNSKRAGLDLKPSCWQVPISCPQ